MYQISRTSAFFEANRGGEAVASVEGVDDLVGVERTIRNDVVVDHAAGIVGEGGEQRVGLTDAEAAELDVSVVDAGASVRRDGEAAAFLSVDYAITIEVNRVPVVFVCS